MARGLRGKEIALVDDFGPATRRRDACRWRQKALLGLDGLAYSSVDGGIGAITISFEATPYGH